ncbi:MAG: Ldh family oxidoreductase [Chloroflexota bacterium]
MNQRITLPSKLEVKERRLIPTDEIIDLATQIFQAAGCAVETAEMVAHHLVETNLKGVESHGVMRLMQYVDQLESGYMDPTGQPTLSQNEKGAWLVDGHDGFGIPALQLGVEKGVAVAKEKGMSTVAIINCGHTGRIGAYVEYGAEAGCLTICIGGGGHKAWPQVAPYGGIKGMFPTNPYAFGIPGGARGPVILDFATAKIAGGWVYAAKSAGTLLPPDAVIDAQGNPTRDPDDYYNGGAILPMAGPKGYGLALLAELIGEAMLGPVTTEMNWFLICIDTSLYNEGNKYQAIAEEILQEIRTSPPASGFNRVEVPGERERDLQAQQLPQGIAIPEPTWQQIVELATRLGVQVAPDRQFSND